MRVGILGGTFDPPHNGHINLALTLQELHGLDRVLFVPAKKNPWKEDPVASTQAREQMVRLALMPLPTCTIYTGEIERAAPSYTVDTLRELRVLYPQEELCLLLGEDAYHRLDQWKGYSEWHSWVTPLVAPRLSNKPSAYPVLSLSSSMLRKRLKEKGYCGHLIPAEVLAYILEHNLY